MKDFYVNRAKTLWWRLTAYRVGQHQIHYSKHMLRVDEIMNKLIMAELKKLRGPEEYIYESMDNWLVLFDFVYMLCNNGNHIHNPDSDAET